MPTTSISTSCTSASAPYVSVVVAMMKMLKGNLDYYDVSKILTDTAIASTDWRVKPGYIVAFSAVEAATPNKPPTIDLTQLANGSKLRYHYVWFAATVRCVPSPARVRRWVVPGRA